MRTGQSSKLLRNLLILDAATCSIMGLVLTVGSGLIARLTALPPALLVTAGLLLFPIAAFMLVTANRAAAWPLAVWLVIAGNAAWVAGSLWLMVGGAVAPNALGHAFIGVQALAVAALAGLEYAASRQASPAFAG